MKDATHHFSFHVNGKNLSLTRRGAWGQVTIASLLITVLPSMILIWLWECHRNGIVLPPETIWGAYAGGLLVVMLGYSLLLKYPVSIVRLRSYLSSLVEGKIPALVCLSKDEDDLAAVQGYLEGIVKMAEDRIRMLKSQYENKLAAERQRVMVESIGAMCHHLGQPATVISMCVYRLRHNPSPGEVPMLLSECETALNDMSETLDKLRGLECYGSESYLHLSAEQAGTAPEKEDRILKR